MSGNGCNRRDFLKRAGALSALGTAVLNNEERILHAFQTSQNQTPENRFNLRREQPVADVPGPLPTSKLGQLTFTRLIAGHNLVGW